MFKNSLIVAFRSLWKRKGFSLINSLGLSVGLASCILIALFIQYQYSFDRFFDDHTSIYRMVEYHTTPEGMEMHSHVPYSFVGTTLKDYPEVEQATAIAGPFSNQRVSIIDKEGQKLNFLESGVLLADSNFFKVFSFDLPQGDRQTVLKNPNSVVLTESTAMRFFGSTDVAGRSINLSGRSSIVTGVCQDPPANSHFKFSYLVSSTTVRWFSQDQFNLRYAKCYFKLNPKADVKALEQKFPNMVDTYMAGEIERINSTTWDEFKNAGNGYAYFLKSIAAIHLDNEIEGGMRAGGNATMLKVLMGVCLLIFIIAAINFMNLSTAMSLERAREVGVRKVMGSTKRQLILQFLSESFIISLIGSLSAVLIAHLLTPTFNSVFDAAISIPFTISGVAVLFIVISAVAFISGLYPALVLSGFKPVNALKGKLNYKNSWVNNGLVAFQFWISMLLIICTLIFQKQVNFLNTKDLGFNKDQLLVVEGTFNMDPNYTRPFLEEARRIPGVKETAGTLWVQGFNGTWSDEYTVGASSTVHTLRRVPLGDRSAEVMGFVLEEGDFFLDQSDDKGNVLLNRAAVEAMGIQNPVGETLNMLVHDEGALEKESFKVIGVVKDFNYESLHNEVEPLVIVSNEVFNGRMSYILVKLNGVNIKETVDQLEATWKETVPDRAFTYRFMDDTLKEKYNAEENLATIFSLFTGLSIFIAGMGLLALSAYAIAIRKKEIGIRKVLGASLSSLLLLLSKNYIQLIVFGLILAIPVAWFVMDHWLQDFAYRVAITSEVFLISGISVLLVCSIAIGSQAIKSALSNPIDSLRED